MRTYKTIETEGVHEQVVKVLQARGYDYKFSQTLADPTKKSTVHLNQYTLQRLMAVCDDGVAPMILLRNSYNKECAFTVQVGLYRFVCANGLVVGTDTFKERIIHVKGEHIDSAQFKLDRIEECINSALDFIEQDLVEKLTKLGSTALDINSRTTIMNGLKLSKRITTKVTRMIEHPLYRRFELRKEDNPDTLWGFYNIINEQLRLSGRSAVAQFNKNNNLLEKMSSLAEAA